MAGRDIVAIGASAGGVEALLFLVKGFRDGFPASVLVTLHLPSHYHSSLDEILAGAGRLPCTFAKDREQLERGHIYVAPPGLHLLVDGLTLSLGSGPRENNARPAIDPMLRSAALCCGGRTIGVVLTGMLGDGASGLWALAESGGTTIVQDPVDAAFPEMPQSALNRSRPHHVVELSRIPALLDKLVRQPAGETRPVPDYTRLEVEVARGGALGMKDLDRNGKRSVLSCPDCGGVMWEHTEGELVRYRCHVGHAYEGVLMSLAIDESLRRALASAMRVLDERAALVGRLREQAIRNGRNGLAELWDARAREYQQEANVIRDRVTRLDPMLDQSPV